MPVKDVAAAGGWSDTATLLRSYQQSDEATLTQVVLEAPKLRANGAGGTEVYPTSYPTGSGGEAARGRYRVTDQAVRRIRPERFELPTS